VICHSSLFVARPALDRRLRTVERRPDRVWRAGTHLVLALIVAPAVVECTVPGICPPNRKRAEQMLRGRRIGKRRRGCRLGRDSIPQDARSWGR